MKARHEHETFEDARECGCLSGRPYPIIEAIVPEGGGDLQCPWCGGPVDVPKGYAGKLSSLGCVQSTGCRRAVGFPKKWKDELEEADAEMAHVVPDSVEVLTPGGWTDATP